MITCAECGRNDRHRSSRNDVQWNETLRKLAEFLESCDAPYSPKAEVTGSNPVGSAKYFNVLVRAGQATYWL